MISRLRPIILSALVFLLVLAMGGAFINLVESQRSGEKRQMLKEIGTAQAHLLERQLDRSLSSTFALASILRQSGRIDNFDALAVEMIRSYGGIGTLQLAPNGVVTQIYPMAGNEAAVGHDLLKDPRRRTEALAAIESRQLTLAGPFTLIQGGEAVIGRLPVFVSNEAGDERFWGFTIALIHLPDLLEVSNLTRLVKYGYDYELSRIDPSSGTRAVFARSTQAGLENTIPFEIEVPNGRWTLAVAPRGGWQSSSFLPVKIGLLFLVSALIAGFTYSLVKRPEVLRRLVVFRTKELAEAIAVLKTENTERKQAEKALRESKENLQRLLETTKAVPWEANAKNWLFTYVGPQAADLLGYPLDEWYQKDFWTSHIHPEDREYAIDFCLKSSSRLRDYEFEYRMIKSDGNSIWLHDIVSVEAVNGAPKTLRGFMIDITERKLEAKQIQQKAKELSTLHDINLAVSSTLDLQIVLNLLAEKTAQLLPYSSAYISLYNQGKGELETIASRNLHTNELRESRRRIVGKSFAQKIFETKNPIVVKNLQTDPRVRDPEFARRHGLKSYIGLPLMVRGKTLGALGFHTKEEHDFSDEEVEFLSTLASQAAVAINNSQLYADIAEKTVELQNTNQQLSALYAVANTVNKSANLESMLQSVMREVLEIFHFDAARVYLLDSQSNELRLNSYQGFPSEAVFLRKHRPGERVTGKAFARGEPLFFEDMESDPEYQAMSGNRTALKAGFRSTFRFPIKFKGKAIGIFAFFCKSVHRFSTSEKELIHSIVNHVGVAVERANLFEEINARVNELSALYSVSKTLSNSMETDLALRSGMHKVLEIFGFESARLYLFDKKEEKLRLLADEGYAEGFAPSRSISLGGGVLGRAFEEGRLVYFEDIRTDPNYLQLHPSGKSLRAGVRGSLTIPIKAKNKVFGVMNFSSKAPHRFTAAEVQLIESIANNMSTVIENLNLFQEVRSRSDELQKSSEELRRLAGKLISAQEDERRRLARELHDDFTQRLAVVAIDVGRLEQQLQSAPALVLKKLHEMKERIVGLSVDIHRISRQLHPSILEDLGLADAIESECTRFSEQERIQVNFKREYFSERLPKEVSLCIYRIAQEGLRNVAKHAHAKEVHIRLVGTNGSLFLSIRDSGVGFDTAGLEGKRGLGLASMEERVRLIRGSLSIYSEPGHGTTIEVRAPLG